MPNGILVIDKPAGWTSMDVCAKLRGILGERRIGHGGTLDPMATGVLPVFVGRATRAVEFAAEAGKEYIAGIKLGLVTNTQDITGEMVEERPACIGRDQLRDVLEGFSGEIEQIPPMYSAIKIKGKKLYELARKGQEVERRPRRVSIYALELLEEEPPEGTDYLLRVACSKGTYVRTLCHDIGQALGCGACMSSLRRTRAAGFGLESAVTLEQAAAESSALLLPVDEYFIRSGWNRKTAVSPAAEKILRNGGQAAVSLPKGEWRVYSQSGEFLGPGSSQGKRLGLIKGFFEV